ncbi:hypothetical protein Tco_0051462 [Tanacetum coccineum]
MDLEEEKKDAALLLKQTRGIQATCDDEMIRKSYSRSSVIDYGRVLPQSDGSSSGVGQRSVRDAITAGTSIPSCFAIYEAEATSSNLINEGNYARRRIKQEPNIDVLDNSKAGGIQIRHRMSQNDLMSVYSE